MCPDTSSTHEICNLRIPAVRIDGEPIHVAWHQAPCSKCMKTSGVVESCNVPTNESGRNMKKPPKQSFLTRSSEVKGIGRRTEAGMQWGPDHLLRRPQILEDNLHLFKEGVELEALTSIGLCFLHSGIGIDSQELLYRCKLAYPETNAMKHRVMYTIFDLLNVQSEEALFSCQHFPFFPNEFTPLSCKACCSSAALSCQLKSKLTALKPS